MADNENTRKADAEAAKVAAGKTIGVLAKLWGGVQVGGADFYLSYGHKVLTEIESNKRIARKALAEAIRESTDPGMNPSKLSRLLKVAKANESVRDAEHASEIIAAIHGNAKRKAANAAKAGTPKTAEDRIKAIVSLAVTAVDKHGVDPVEILSAVAEGIGIDLADINAMAKEMREQAQAA